MRAPILVVTRPSILLPLVACRVMARGPRAQLTLLTLGSISRRSSIHRRDPASLRSLAGLGSPHHGAPPGQTGRLGS